MIFSVLKNIIKRPFYSLYEKRMEQVSKQWDLPSHIGIILDGNRRWAKIKGLSKVIDGHARGADKLEEVLDWCYESGIEIVTIWIFSTENFSRPQEEVDELLELIEARIRDLEKSPTVHSRELNVGFIGRIELLPDSLQEAIEQLKKSTANYNKHKLNVAIAYGGREEIVDGVRCCISESLEGGKDIDTILEELDHHAIDKHMYLTDSPEPDLIIRTSGEIRLSGFLLWQSAYSEYYFCDTFWPQFRKIDYLRALRSYDQRQRRYGK
ncbi:MAG: di-trans,poly-cis-decaprenylcistransferase [Lentisphaeria bacterium]|nr:polyprenyl diphosphate synthase [Lentisphaeria bacterium]NQZ70773.1 di-trans,poly-cis-decaprenylcistransferase [Lentisphaeria bacterium]